MEQENKTKSVGKKNWLIIGLLVGLIPSFMFSLGLGLAYGLYLGFGGIPGGVLGAYIGNRGTLSAVGVAIIGALLGSFFWILLFTTAQG